VKTANRWRKHLSSHAAEIVQALVLVGGGLTPETQARLEAARDDFANQMRADGLTNRQIGFVLSEFDVAVEKQLSQLNSSTRGSGTLAGGRRVTAEETHKYMVAVRFANDQHAVVAISINPCFASETGYDPDERHFFRVPNEIFEVFEDDLINSNTEHERRHAIDEFIRRAEALEAAR
jgi:hypothetical protein